METDKNNPRKIINLGYLIGLSKGNNVFVKEMIDLFLSENPEEIKSLEKGILEKNYEVIKNTAHKLKSTIPFIGLDKVIQSEVSEVEKLASSKSELPKIEKLFLKIKEMCERACCELQPV